MSDQERDIKRFDFKRKPKKQSNIWKLVMWGLTAPKSAKHDIQIEKINMSDLKPPYLLLSNHTSFFDFYVLAKAILPHRANYVITLDAFKDYTEWLLRAIGGICKRRFIFDLNLIRNMKYSVTKNKNILVMYPEAKYSIDGTTSVIPKSLGKMIKMLDVPVVVLNMKGTYVARPQWNKIKRDIPFRATMTKIITKEELQTLSIDEINARVKKALSYNDWDYLKEANLSLPVEDRAKGLNKLLYKCPHCLEEGQMIGENTLLKCNACGKEWNFQKDGTLSSVDGEVYFDSVPKWYAWERKMVREEINNGTYHFEAKVFVQTLPNAQKYYDQGEGYLVHDYDGYHLDCKYYGKEYHNDWSVPKNYSCHIEYDYKDYGDAVALSIDNDTFWLYPQNTKDVVTKLSLATEELYKYHFKEKAKNSEKLS